MPKLIELSMHTEGKLDELANSMSRRQLQIAIRYLMVQLGKKKR